MKGIQFLSRCLLILKTFSIRISLSQNWYHIYKVLSAEFSKNRLFFNTTDKRNFGERRKKKHNVIVNLQNCIFIISKLVSLSKWEVIFLNHFHFIMKLFFLSNCYIYCSWWLTIMERCLELIEKRKLWKNKMKTFFSFFSFSKIIQFLTAIVRNLKCLYCSMIEIY